MQEFDELSGLGERYISLRHLAFDGAPPGGKLPIRLILSQYVGLDWSNEGLDRGQDVVMVRQPLLPYR